MVGFYIEGIMVVPIGIGYLSRSSIKIALPSCLPPFELYFSRLLLSTPDSYDRPDSITWNSHNRPSQPPIKEP
jgi:hypothetical protein